MNSLNRNIQQPNNNNKNAPIDVEDISGDEISITSAKGEGFASDLSDSEMGHKQYGGTAARRSAKKGAGGLVFAMAEPSLKRPNTPMDFRAGVSGPHTNITNQGGGPAAYQQVMSTSKIASNRPVDSAAKSVRFQHDIPIGKLLLCIYISL